MLKEILIKEFELNKYKLTELKNVSKDQLIEFC